jgi:hypothetical protein
MIKYLIPLLLLLPGTLLAHGGEHRLTWVMPAGDLTANVYCGQESGVYKAMANKLTSSEQNILALGFPDGINYCVVTAVNSSNIESDYSNEVAFDVLDGEWNHTRPDAPTGYRIITIHITIQ